MNCINHGDITAFAKYGVATSAGISAEIENAYIANCYSNGSVSSSNTGNLSAGFQISQYECENCEELNTGINNSADANAFISSYDSPEILLNWFDDSGVITLCGDYFSYPIAQHGNCHIYVFPEDSNKNYMLKIWTENSDVQSSISVVANSPIEVRGLTPDTEYLFELLSEDGAQSLDKGKFNTLIPNIILQASSIGYDNIEFKHSCDAKGVDSIKTQLLFNQSEMSPYSIELTDSVICVDSLDEETNYTAELAYYINGKEYHSDKIDVTTMAIIPEFGLISQTPYSLTIKCDNFEDIRKFHPGIYIERILSTMLSGAIRKAKVAFMN